MVEICAIPTKPLCHNGSRLDGLITPTLKAAGSNPVGRTKTVSSNMLETVFICRKLGELKPDLTTTAHFAIQLSYYAMSYLQHPLQSRAGGFFVLVEGVVVDIQRGGGLAVAEDARHRCHIRAACDHQTGGGVPEGVDVQLLR